MIRRIIKEFFFCLLIAIISILMIVLNGIVGLPENAGLRFIIWIVEGFLSYFAIVFIPCFQKRKKHYFDGLGLLSAFGSIVIICLFRSENVDDYGYVSMLGFFGGLPFIAEIINLFRRKHKSDKIISKVNNLEDFILKEFENYEKFDLIQITSILKISEYKARKIVNSLIEKGKIQVIKDGIKNYYLITNDNN